MEETRVMKMKRIYVLLLCGIMALHLTACGSEETEMPQAPAGIAVQVTQVQKETISTENQVSGQVVSDNQTTIMIGSPAKCTAVYAEAGDTIRAGEKICKLDLGSSLSSYNAARISYESAVQSYQDQKTILEKQIQMAEDNVNNTKELFKIGAASQLEIDQAELSYENAVAGRNSALSQLEAGMQNAKSGMQQLDTALENVDGNGNVIAPASGTLVTMNGMENMFISNTAPLAVIDGAAQMKIMVQVSESLVPHLHTGDPVDVSVEALSQKFEGSIRSVERAANMQTQLYTVTISIPDDAEGLLSGMFADVVFHTNVTENAVVVPTEAILTSGETEYVFIADEEGKARYIEVKTGLTGSGVTEVTSGLEEGMQLITVGQAYLVDGDAVRIITEED